jgi:hypothetical protein
MRGEGGGLALEKVFSIVKNRRSSKASRSNEIVSSLARFPPSDPSDLIENRARMKISINGASGHVKYCHSLISYRSAEAAFASSALSPLLSPFVRASLSLLASALPLLPLHLNSADACNVRVVHARALVYLPLVRAARGVSA